MSLLEKGVKYSALGVLPVVMVLGVGCTPTADSPMPSATRVPATASSFATEVLPLSPTPVRTASTPTPLTPPSPTKLPSNDSKTKLLIDQAKGGEVITIEGEVVKRIIRSPWIGGTATVATIDSAVLTQADCVYDAFRAGNRLGAEHLGSWKPGEIVDSMQAKVSIPTSIVSPTPFLDLQSIIYKGKSYICHQVTAGEELKKLLHTIDWKNVPDDIGTILGSIIRKFVQGFKGGLKSP